MAEENTEDFMISNDVADTTENHMTGPIIKAEYQDVLTLFRYIIVSSVSYPEYNGAPYYGCLCVDPNTKMPMKMVCMSTGKWECKGVGVSKCAFSFFAKDLDEMRSRGYIYNIEKNKMPIVIHRGKPQSFDETGKPIGFVGGCKAGILKLNSLAYNGQPSVNYGWPIWTCACPYTSKERVNIRVDNSTFWNVNKIQAYAEAKMKSMRKGAANSKKRKLEDTGNENAGKEGEVTMQVTCPDE